MERVPVMYIDVDDAKATRILLVDNRTNDLAMYDDAGLLAVLQTMVDLGGLDGTGYNSNDLTDLIGKLEAPNLETVIEAGGDVARQEAAGEVALVRVTLVVSSDVARRLSTMMDGVDATNDTDRLAQILDAASALQAAGDETPGV